MNPAADDSEPAELEPSARDVLEAVEIDPGAVLEGEVSYRDLVDAGVAAADADALRRQHSLAWTFEAGEELAERSDGVSGLDAAEREWVRASADGSWEDLDPPPEVDSTDPTPRPVPRPTPVTRVAGIGEETAATLAEAGITSLERLATIDATQIATLLDLDIRHVRTWRHAARDALE
ncbi:MAG: hypothetical protein U5K37_08045 [Natrialbaceae archaeon]|nr:hypothetical protein [Natrialbaceae archaeon]